MDFSREEPDGKNGRDLSFASSEKPNSQPAKKKGKEKKKKIEDT